MDNSNRDSGNTTVEKINKSTAARYQASAGAAAISREKLVVLLAMFAFALVLFSLVLVFTLVGDSDGYDMLGGIDNSPGVGGSNGNGGGNADNHKHDYAYELELVDGKFNLLAKCGNEGCDKPEYKETNVSDVLLTSETPATCTEDGERNYSLTKDGKTTSYTEKLSAVGHKLDGVDVSEKKDANGHLAYDGVIVGVKDGVELVCNTTYEEGGFFKCSACEEDIPNSVIVGHLPGEDGDNTYMKTVTETTCTVDGCKVLCCKYCDEAVGEEEITPAFGHKLNGVSVSELEYVEGRLVYDGSNLTISSDVTLACNSSYDEGGSYKCSACEEDVPTSFFIYHLTSKDGGNADWETVKAATCTEDGLEILKCTACDSSLQSERVIPALGHKINGVSISELKNENGYLVYDGIDIKALPGVELVCNSAYEEGGFYECSACEIEVPTAFATVHVAKDSSVSENWVILEGDEPTCMAKGKETLFCKCGSETLEEKEIKKLPHRINDIPVSEYKNEDGYLIYDEAYITYVFPDAVLMCGNVCEDAGIYKCSSCSIDILTDFYVPHIAKDAEDEANWVILDGDAPTCTEEGRRVLCCKFCDLEIMDEQTIDATGHSYVDSLALEGDVVNLITTCSNNCGTETVKDVTSELRIAEYVKPNCGTREKTTYAYDYTDGREPLTVVKYGEMASRVHVFNYEGRKPDGTYDYIPGYTLPIDPEGIECGKTVKGCFVLKCTMCDDGISSPITVNVPKHNYTSKLITKEPNFSKLGYVTVSCGNSDWGCDHKVEKIELGRLRYGENIVRDDERSTEEFLVFDYSTKIMVLDIEIEINIKGMTFHIDDVPMNARPADDQGQSS